jgi:hypothetical protein
MNPLMTSVTSPTKPSHWIGLERRSDRRYELALTVRWRLIRRRRVVDSGTGTTVDVSSGGLLLETDRELETGLMIELSIAWPVLLHNVAPLQLVVAGRVVRAQGRRVAVRMLQHEFRTAGVSRARRSGPELMPRSPLSAASTTPSRVF